MPTWSLQEMQACREQLYSDVTPDTAAQRYSWLGGSIRHVLVKTGASPEQLVLPAVQKQSAEDLVFAVSQASTWESDFSHTMGHFKVCQAVCACGHPHSDAAAGRSSSMHSMESANNGLMLSHVTPQWTGESVAPSKGACTVWPLSLRLSICLSVCLSVVCKVYDSIGALLVQQCQPVSWCCHWLSLTFCPHCCHCGF